MIEKSMNARSLKNVLIGVAVWSISLALLSLSASLIAAGIVINEKQLNFIGSAVTFFSSLTAGVSLRGKEVKIIYCIMLSSLITVIALSVGFLLDSSKIETGGILSVASFTFSGTLCGYILKVQKKKRDSIKLSS